MKKYTRNILYLLAFSVIVCVSPACSKKVGCPVNEQVHTKMSKRGKVKGKTKSGLFDKKTSRKIQKSKR